MSNILDDNTPVFYVPGRPGIIDVAILRDGEQVGHYSGETLPQINLRHPGVILGLLGLQVQASEDYFRHGPIAISEERYIDMLEVLPPVAWYGIGSAEESFKLSERTSGNITAIFCRLDERYFEMQDSIFMKHADIVTACRTKAAT